MKRLLIIVSLFLILICAPKLFLARKYKVVVEDVVGNRREFVTDEYFIRPNGYMIKQEGKYKMITGAAVWLEEVK